MDQSHFRAMWDVDAGGEGRGCEHGDERHAVHVVGDGLGVVEAEAAPAFTLGGFEALEEVEEGDWGRSFGSWKAGGKSGEDAGDGPGFGVFDLGAGEDVGGFATVNGRLVCHL